MDTLQQPRHQAFFDKGNALLEQFKNRWKEDQACSYKNKGGHTDSVVGDELAESCSCGGHGISSKRYCSGCRGSQI
jgi:hypothetical protein